MDVQELSGCGSARRGASTDNRREQRVSLTSVMRRNRRRVIVKESIHHAECAHRGQGMCSREAGGEYNRGRQGVPERIRKQHMMGMMKSSGRKSGRVGGNQKAGYHRVTIAGVPNKRSLCALRDSEEAARCGGLGISEP